MLQSRPRDPAESTSATILILLGSTIGGGRPETGGEVLRPDKNLFHWSSAHSIREATRCSSGRLFVVTTDSRHSLPVYPNLIREMNPTAINQLWVATGRSGYGFLAGARSFRTILPPFITNLTRCSSVMSASGSPDTATRSAYLPFPIEPI